MVGVQGAGKTTLVRQRFAGTHEVVSKDHWPNAKRREARQRNRIEELLAGGQSVVVDNTNPAPEDRYPLIEIAQRHDARVIAVYLDVPFEVARDRNLARSKDEVVPEVGLRSVAKRLVQPTLDEGFDEVEVVGSTPWEG